MTMEQRNAIIRRMLADGKSCPKIAKVVGVSKQRVHQIARHILKIPKKRRLGDLLAEGIAERRDKRLARWALLVQRVKNGEKLTHVARDAKCDVNSLHRYVAAAGIKLTPGRPFKVIGI